MRRAAKRDKTEQAIVRVLRLTGWSVQPLSLAYGPDLLLGRAGVNVLAEVKSGNEQLRPKQVEWHARWNGSKPFLLRDVEDVIRLNQIAPPAAYTASLSTNHAQGAALNLKTIVVGLTNSLKPESSAPVATRKLNGKRTSRRGANDSENNS